MKNYLYLILSLFFYSCESTKKIHRVYREYNSNKYLGFYNDSTFHYWMNTPCTGVILGLGKYKIINDTLKLIYTNKMCDTNISKTIIAGKSTWKNNKLNVKIDTTINTSIHCRDYPTKIELHKKKLFVFFNSNESYYRIFYKL